MSILELNKNAIIVVNAILSMFLIRAISFFVKIEFGKIVLLDHIADVKVLISILDALEYITLFTFVNILVLLCMLVNTYIKKSGGVKNIIMLILMQFVVLCICVLSWFDVTFSLKFNGDIGLEDTIDVFSSLIIILICEITHNIFLYKLKKQPSWYYVGIETIKLRHLRLNLN